MLLAYTDKWPYSLLVNFRIYNICFNASIKLLHSSFEPIVIRKQLSMRGKLK